MKLKKKNAIMGVLGYLFVLIMLGLLAFFLYIVLGRAEGIAQPAIDSGQSVSAPADQSAPAPVGCPSGDCKG